MRPKENVQKWIYEYLNNNEKILQNAINQNNYFSKIWSKELVYIGGRGLRMLLYYLKVINSEKKTSKEVFLCVCRCEEYWGESWVWSS